MKISSEKILPCFNCKMHENKIWCIVHCIRAVQSKLQNLYSRNSLKCIYQNNNTLITVKFSVTGNTLSSGQSYYNTFCHNWSNFSNHLQHSLSFSQKNKRPKKSGCIIVYNALKARDIIILCGLLAEYVSCSHISFRCFFTFAICSDES